jgi:hypothetical protein
MGFVCFLVLFGRGVFAMSFGLAGELLDLMRRRIQRNKQVQAQHRPE